MQTIVEVRRTYKYRLYASKHNFHLHDTINVSGIIWNHLVALKKRYYRLFKKHIPLGRMQGHISKLRMKTERFAFWEIVGSQAAQQLCERHETAWQKFFAKKGKPPRFKKVKKYKSFTLKQSGWKLHEDTHKRGGKKHPKRTGHIRLLGRDYKFVKHRPMRGEVKTVTVKRDVADRLWVCFSVVEKVNLENEISTGEIGGFDFGLKTFLTTNDGHCIESPQFFSQDLPRLRTIQRQVSKKVDGSANKKNCKKHLARRHIRVADKRRDFHFQLAHKLFYQYDTLVFEDLNMDGMKRLWGRKVSDLGFAQFIRIVQWMAMKRGKRVILVDRWELTTGKCSGCGHCQPMALKERTFCCEKCHLTLDRDHNAAINIVEAGHRLMLSQSVEDRAKSAASGVNVRSPSL